MVWSGRSAKVDKIGGVATALRRVNHSNEYVGEDGANVNQAEPFFSRLRRAEIGIHHRISGQGFYQ